MGHRRGRGQILTAQQLKERLAVPVFYIIKGRAQAAFPESRTPSPSPFVQVILTGALFDEGHRANFPVTVNWRQWRDVVVPVIEDERWPLYLGSTGGVTNPVTPGIPDVSVGAGLYDGQVDTLIELIGDQLRLEGFSNGYGNPDEEPYGEGTC